jgi:hypothetical protein
MNDVRQAFEVSVAGEQLGAVLGGGGIDHGIGGRELVLATHLGGAQRRARIQRRDVVVDVGFPTSLTIAKPLNFK